MAQKPRIDLNIASNAVTIAKNFKDLAQAITRVTQLRNAINADGKKNKPLSFDIDFKQMDRLEKAAEDIKSSLGSLSAESKKVAEATSKMFDTDATKNNAVQNIAAINVLLEQSRNILNGLDNKVIEIKGDNTNLVESVKNSLTQLKKLKRQVVVDVEMRLPDANKGDSYKALWKNYVNAAQSAMKSSKKFAEFAKGDTFKIPSYTKDYKAFFEEYNKATDIEGKVSALARHFKGNHAFGQLINAINNNAIDKLGIKGKNFDKVVDAVRPFADMSKMLDYRKNGKSDELKPKTIKIEGDISGLKTAVEEAHRLINGLPTKTIKIEGQVTAKAKGGGGGKQKKPVNWDDEYRDVWGSKPEKLSKKLNRINDLQDAINSGLWTNAPDDAMQKLQFKKMEYSKARSATKNNLTVTQDYNLDLAKREQAEVESAQRVANRRRIINQARLIMESNDEAKIRQRVLDYETKVRSALSMIQNKQKEKDEAKLQKDLANQNKNNVNLGAQWFADEKQRMDTNSDYHKRAWEAIVAAENKAKKELDNQQKEVDNLLAKLDKLKKDYQLAVESQTKPSDRQALKNDYEEADTFKALAMYGVNPNALGYYRQWNVGNRNKLNTLIPENTKANDHTQRLLTIQGQYNEEIAKQNALLERGEMVTQKYVDNSVAKLEKLKREYEELGGEKEKLQIIPFAGMSAKEINTRNSMRNLDAWKDQYFSTANEKVNALTGSLERAYSLIRRNPGNVGIKRYIKETEVELKKAQREADIINRKMKLLNPDNLTKGWEHKLRWIGGAFGFYETYDFLGRAGEAIKEFEVNMANLRTVMPSLGEPLSIDPIEALKNNRSIDKEMQKATYEDQQRRMINIGAKYGVSNSDIIESARLWGRMYKERETVNLLTAQSAKLAVADNFSMEESTKAVEAAMFQFGMQAHSTAEALAYSNRIIDVYTKLSHNAGVTAQDLAAAVERSGSVAHQAGMSFEFLNALIAQATRSTALSGSAIGTMLKTFIASIRSDKAVKELDKIGIKVKEVGEDGVERFRDIQQVILDIAIQTKYTNNDIQKTLLAISGGRRKLAA